LLCVAVDQELVAASGSEELEARSWFLDCWSCLAAAHCDSGVVVTDADSDCATSTGLVEKSSSAAGVVEVEAENKEMDQLAVPLVAGTVAEALSSTSAGSAACEKTARTDGVDHVAKVTRLTLVSLTAGYDSY